MYEFLDRFVTIALPRVRDFRGISGRAFDGRGNYNIGVKEQIIFPEIEYDKIDALRGMNISITTTAKTDEEAKRVARRVQIPVQELKATMAKLALINREREAQEPGQEIREEARCAAVDRQRREGFGRGAFRRAPQAPGSCPATPTPTRMRNRCALTGRPRGVFSKFGLGRNKLREYRHARRDPGHHQGQLVGTQLEGNELAYEHD